MTARRLLRLAADAAATICELNRRIRADPGTIGTTQRSGDPCAAAWHFMIVRALAVDASSLGPGVAAPCAELDRLNSTDYEELNLASWAAETKRIFSI